MRSFRACAFLTTILLSYLCLLPVDSLPDDQPFLMLGIAALAAAQLFAGFKPRFQFTLLTFLSVISLLFLMSHWYFSDWPWMSLWLGLCLALLPVGVILASNEDWSPVLKQFLPWVVVAVGGANAFAIIYQGAETISRPGGFLLDPNLSANVLAIAVLCSAYLYLSRLAGHWVLWCTALLSVGLFFAQSRGAWLALFSSGIVLSLVFFLSEKRSAFRFVLLVLALLAGYMAPLFLSGLGLAESLGIGERGKSLGYRFEIWASAWDLILQHPTFGSGVGTFPLRYPAVRSDLEISTTGHFAHSDIIQLIVELGFFGAIVYLSVPLTFAMICAKRFFSGGFSFGLPVLALCVLLLVGLHGLVNFIVYHPLVALTVGLLVGLASSDLMSRVHMTMESPARRTLLAGCLSGIVVLSVMCVSDSLASRKIAQISKNAGLISLQSELYYDLLFLEMFSPLNVGIKNFIIEAESVSAIGLVGSRVGDEFRKQVIKRVEQNRWFYKPNCTQLSERARLLWIDDEIVAIQALEDLIKVAPNCHRARLYLSEALLDQRRFQEAELVLESAYERFKFGEVNSRQASALLDALAEVLRRQGRESEAKSVDAFTNNK